MWPKDARADALVLLGVRRILYKGSAPASPDGLLHRGSWTVHGALAVPY
jgi:hypothetical protein